jgi:ISXO2-like transposase domain
MSARATSADCSPCRAEDFTIRTGTIFERSHVPLHKWLYAMYLLVTARKGISSMQLAKEIGITQKSAWFVLHRLREACGSKLETLQGIVESDETYVGGIEKSKHESTKLRAGRGTVGKTAILAMRERGGRTIAMPIERTDKKNHSSRYQSTCRERLHSAYRRKRRVRWSTDPVSSMKRSITAPVNMYEMM